MTITVGESERSKTAMARARAHPVPWKVLKRRITEQDGPHTRHVEDQPFAPERPPAEFVDLPFGYVVAISFEEQPAGMCLHVSVSGPWPRVAPNMVVWMALRWTATAILEAEKGFRRLKAHKQLPILRTALQRHQQTLFGDQSVVRKNLAA